MKNYVKYWCIIGAFSLLAVVGCSSDDDDDSMMPTEPPEEEPAPTPTPVEDAVSFASQIKPIIEKNCTPCHVSGGNNTNYSTHSNASASIDVILNRINRTEGMSGFMPRGGQKLSEENLALIQQWKDDGLAE